MVLHHIVRQRFHNSPLNQFICSSHWLWAVQLYLVHAGIKKKKESRKKSLLILKVVQVWSMGQFCNVQIALWTFVCPCSYLFTRVLALVTRNHGHSLYKPRHNCFILLQCVLSLFCFSKWLLHTEQLKPLLSVKNSSYLYKWNCICLIGSIGDWKSNGLFCWSILAFTSWGLYHPLALTS